MTRWTIRRKAAVVEKLITGTWSAQELCARYAMTVEELEAWVRDYERGGPKAMRVTRLQENRDKREHPPLRARGQGSTSSAFGLFPAR